MLSLITTFCCINAIYGASLTHESQGGPVKIFWGDTTDSQDSDRPETAGLPELPTEFLFKNNLMIGHKISLVNI